MPNVVVYEKREILTINNKKILLLPWITNIPEFINEFEDSIETYDVILGHLSIIGFDMGGRYLL